jgi:hypothetical protein
MRICVWRRGASLSFPNTEMMPYAGTRDEQWEKGEIERNCSGLLSGKMMVRRYA